MTTDERLNRIEHVTAGLDEQFRREREENRTLWRETQRQMAEGFARVDAAIAETNASLAKTNATVDRLAREAREADQALGERIAGLVSTMGDFLRKAELKK